MNKIQLSNAAMFNHGCRNYAEATDNGDGTATVTHVDSCHSCWQVGHDQDYQYMQIGQVISLDDRADEIVTGNI